MATCACGACRKCRLRQAQARYQRTEKGKAALAKYKRSAAGRAANARYLQSPRGREVNAVHNAKRIYVGYAYHGRARSVEHATVIRSHIKERLIAFIKGFSTRAETEGATACPVPSEAIARAD